MCNNSQMKCVALFLVNKIIHKAPNKNSEMSQNKESSESLKCPQTYFEWCALHKYTARWIVDFPVDIDKVWRRLPTELNVQHNFNVFNRDVESWLFSHLCL